MRIFLTVLISYLLGSISSGVILSRVLTHNDIRKQGSGNAGTTNMLRVHGKKLAALTLVGDMLKGILAVYLGARLVGGVRGELLGATFAVLGHNFPVFFNFKGGKGIATSFGCLLIIFPLQTLCALVIFVIIFVTTHYVSVGSIACAVALPVLVCLTGPKDPVIWGCIWFLGILAIVRHYQNIIRLLQHRENKIDFAVFKK